MRKIIFTVLASGALLAIGSSVALADHHDGRHERRHEARHERHEAHHHRSGFETRTVGGTVAAFSGGVLTLRLRNGSTVSGRVTPATELECDGMERTDDRGDDDARSCATGDLVPGATVDEARLRASGAGAVWDKIELIHREAADFDS